jgi:hypothetical protein
MPHLYYFLPPRPPSPPRKTAVPLVFFTHYMDATCEQTDGLVPISRVAAHSSAPSDDAHNNIAPIAPEFAQDAPAPSATTSQPHAARVDNAITSTSPTACFLGIPTEVRLMIYGYVWTPEVDVYIDPPSHLHPNTVHPICHANRQIRFEAIDSLRREQTVTLHFHASVKDLDFTSVINTLEGLDNNKHLGKRGGGQRKLHMHISIQYRAKWSQSYPPGSFPKLTACLKKLVFGAEYDYSFTDKGGVEIGGRLAVPPNARSPFDS